MDIEIKDENAKYLEEIHYLARNKLFLKEIEKIRKKNKIPLTGITGDADTHYLNSWAIKQRQHFHKDFDPLLQRCTGGKSEDNWKFGSILRNFILDNKLPTASPKALGGMVTPIKLQIVNNQIDVTFPLSFDTTKEEVKKRVDDYWQDIKNFQKKLVESKLKVSPNFALNNFFWEQNKLFGKTVSEIERMDENTTSKGYSQYEIQKIINRYEKRIKSSFK